MVPKKPKKDKITITYAPPATERRSEAERLAAANEGILKLAGWLGRQMAREDFEKCQTLVLEAQKKRQTEARKEPEAHSVDVLEFQRNLGQYQEAAKREPVEIVQDGERAFVLMSVTHYDLLMAMAQRRRATDYASE